MLLRYSNSALLPRAPKLDFKSWRNRHGYAGDVDFVVGGETKSVAKSDNDLLSSPSEKTEEPDPPTFHTYANSGLLPVHKTTNPSC